LRDLQHDEIGDMADLGMLQIQGFQFGGVLPSVLVLENND
jgi:hypothetical protein